MATPVWIYALIDPSCNEPRYVGKTARSVAWRYKTHLAAARRGKRLPVYSWLRGTIAADNPAIAVSLEVVPADADWQERERFWISHYRGLGLALYNETDGGEGLSGRRMPAEHKKKIAAALRTGKHFNCQTCGKQFWRRQYKIKDGNCKYCSRECYSKSRIGVRMPVRRDVIAIMVGAAAKLRRARSHCKHGHPYSAQNLYVTKAGYRSCRECAKLRMRRTVAARKMQHELFI